MSFQYSGYIRKNNKKLRDALEKRGICPNTLDENLWNDDFWLISNYGYYCTIQPDEFFVPDLNKDINCEYNEFLFITISSIRNDTDKYQLFIDDNGHMTLCESSIINPYSWRDNFGETLMDFPRKATITEIIKLSNEIKK